MERSAFGQQDGGELVGEDLVFLFFWFVLLD